MNTAEMQKDIDLLCLEYKRKKREVERQLAEMRIIRKQIDIMEDKMIVETMKSREQPHKEVLCS